MSLLRNPAQRPTAFRLGLLTGLGAFLLSALAVYVFILRPNPEPEFNVEVISVGVDVSRHGGQSIEISNAGGVLFTATCRGGCDNLQYRARSAGDDSYGVRVLDASGRCIACETEAYVSAGFWSPVERWVLAGKTKLQGAPRSYYLRRDGTFEPAELNGSETAPNP